MTPRAFLAATDPPEPVQGGSSYGSSRDALLSAIAVPPREVPDTLEKSRTSPPYRQSKDSKQKSLMYEYLHTHIYTRYIYVNIYKYIYKEMKCDIKFKISNGIHLSCLEHFQRKSLMK